MYLDDILPVLETLAPLHRAEAWDNVGLLLGSPKQKVSRVMCCIDLTHAVLQEAKAGGCELVVAYHPVIFAGLKSLSYDSVLGQAARAGMALYCPHTALDAAEGGTNDVLAGALQLTACVPLSASPPRLRHYKLVVFVPGDSSEAVAAALFAAGAGRIGNYSHCSFQHAGTGTFKGEAGSAPVFGRPGEMQRVDEMRLEVVVPQHQATGVIAALQAAHPYEEVAFDLIELSPAPSGPGMGRLGMLSPPVSLQLLAARLKEAFLLPHLLQAAAAGQDSIAKVACCAGAGGALLEHAVKAGAELFVTGELRHHDVLRAKAHGMSVLCTLHSNSERAALTPFSQRLQVLIPELEVRLSTQDRDPLRFV